MGQVIILTSFSFYPPVERAAGTYWIGGWVEAKASLVIVEKREISYPSRNVESSWNVMAHGDAREGKWRGKWRMEWVASTFHTTSELGVSSITPADAHTSATTSSRLNWRPCRFKWTRPFHRKKKSGFCACAIIFQTHSTAIHCTFSL